MADNTTYRRTAPSPSLARCPGTAGSNSTPGFSHVTASVVSVPPSPSWAMPPASPTPSSPHYLPLHPHVDLQHPFAIEDRHLQDAHAPPFTATMPPPSAFPSRNGRLTSLPPSSSTSAAPSLNRSRPSTSVRSTISSASLGVLAPTLASSHARAPQPSTLFTASRKRTAERAALGSSPPPPLCSAAGGRDHPSTLLACQSDPNDSEQPSMSMPRPPTTRASNRPATRARSVATTAAGAGQGGGVSEPEHRFLVALFSPKGVTGVSSGGDSRGGTGGGGTMGSGAGSGTGPSGEIGICVFDLVTTTCLVSQFIDSKSLVRTLNKLNVYPPSHLIVPSTFYKTEKSEIAILLESNLDGAVEVVPISRKHFSFTNGLDYIRQYALQDQVRHLETSLGPYALGLSAVAAMFKFIEAERHITFTRSGVHFVHESVSGTMFIDTITARNLELVRNQTGLHGHTLLGVLNKCQTVMGARFLRSTILQPPAVPETIELRLDAVAELVSIPSSVQSLLSSLSQVPNIDKLISGFIHIHHKSTTVKSSELDLALILDLRTALLAFPALLTALAPFTNPLLTQAQDILSHPTLDVMLVSINELFSLDLALTSTPMGQRNARAFAIKPGVHGLLDVSRRTYQESVADIMQLVDDYSTRLKVPLRALYQAASHGFMLECKADQIPPEMLQEGGWPEAFVNVVWKSKAVTFNTLEVMKLNERVKESMNEIFLISDRIVMELKEELRSKVGVLYKVSESIALVDLLCCFTRFSLSSTYVRPMLSRGMTVIAQGRHPILSVLATRSTASNNRGTAKCADPPEQPYVPNDTYLDFGCNTQIVTGANGAGKTSYLKQVALITIMAHMGCPVPAQEAVVCLTELMLSRMSFDDSMLTGASSYMLEMREVAHILQEIAEVSWVEKPRSEANGGGNEDDQASVVGTEGGATGMVPTRRSALVLMDEIGRGTSPTEAAGMAFAIVEALSHTKAFVLFATHFHHLFSYLEPYPNIVHLHLSMHITTPSPGSANLATTLTYDYRVQDGASPMTRGYGIQLAASLGLPAAILATSERVADQVARMHGLGRPAGEASPEYAFVRVVHECARRVVAIKYNPHLDDDDRERCLRVLHAEMRQSFPGLQERSEAGSRVWSRVGETSQDDHDGWGDADEDVDAMYDDYEMPMSPYPRSPGVPKSAAHGSVTPIRQPPRLIPASSSVHLRLSPPAPQDSAARSTRAPWTHQEPSPSTLMLLTDRIGKYDPVSGTFVPLRPSQGSDVADSVLSADATDPIED